MAESMAAKPNMQRLVSQFAGALKDANRGAADEVGMGAEYDAAMKQYAAQALDEAEIRFVAECRIEGGYNHHVSKRVIEHIKKELK